MIIPFSVKVPHSPISHLIHCQRQRSAKAATRNMPAPLTIELNVQRVAAKTTLQQINLPMVQGIQFHDSALLLISNARQLSAQIRDVRSSAFLQLRVARSEEHTSELQSLMR